MLLGVLEETKNGTWIQQLQQRTKIKLTPGNE